MRRLMALAVIAALSGCSAILLGGGSAGSGYKADKDERSTSNIAADTALSTSIMSKFAADTTSGLAAVGVQTYMRLVTLSGTVGNYAVREKAEKIAIDTDGVRAVNNEILVRESD